MKTDKMKFNVTIRLFKADITDKKHPLETIKIPLNEIYDSYETADTFLHNTLNEVLPFQFPEPNFTHFVYVHVSHTGIEFEKIPAVFPVARSFNSYNDAKEFCNKYTDLVLNSKEV